LGRQKKWRKGLFTPTSVYVAGHSDGDYDGNDGEKVFGLFREGKKARGKKWKGKQIGNKRRDGEDDARLGMKPRNLQQTSRPPNRNAAAGKQKNRKKKWEKKRKGYKTTKGGGKGIPRKQRPAGGERTWLRNKTFWVRKKKKRGRWGNTAEVSTETATRKGFGSVDLVKKKNVGP